MIISALSIAVLLLLTAESPVSGQELPKQDLTVGLILNKEDDISRKVVGLAIQMANVELEKMNYRLQAETETLDENSSFNVIRKACNLLSHGLIAIISPIAASPSRHVSSFCSKFHIPHLVTSCRFPETPDAYPMEIRIAPDCDQFSGIIYQYITKVENWNDMVVIHSADDSILRFESLVNQFEMPLKMKHWKHHDLVNNKLIMKELSSMKKYRHFIVDLPFWQIRDFLIMASVHNMTEPQFSFLFADWDSHLVDIAAFKINNRVNISTFSIINQTAVANMKEADKNIESLIESIIDAERSAKKADISKNFLSLPAIVFDSITLIAKGLVKLAKARPLAGHKMSCNKNETWQMGPSLINAMTSVDDLYGITGKIVFNEKAHRRHYNLSIMECTEDGFVKSGFWLENKFTIFPKKVEELEIPKRNEHQPLRVTTVIDNPFVFYKDSRITSNYDPDPSNWDGYCLDLLTLIGKDLGLNFTIIPAKDTKYGNELNDTYPDGRKKWNGMIGELLTGQADLAVAPMTISYERERVVDFTTPFMSLGLSILFLRPKKEAPGLFSFLSPLQPLVWAYVMSAYVVVSIVLCLICQASPYEWQPSHPCDDSSDPCNQFGFLNCLWFAVGALVRQGIEICPHASSARVVSGAWWFFTLIIISTYTANLAAFLTVERFVLPIKSVEDLANQTKIKYGTLDGGASYAFFERAQLGTYRRMFKFMKAHKSEVIVTSTKEGIQKVRDSDGKYAFLLESAWNDYFVQRDCSLMRVGDLLDSKGYGIGFPTGSPLREKMTESILKLQKSQDLDRLKRKWWNEMNITEPCDVKEPGGTPMPLNVTQVGGVFILMGAGFVFALFIVMIELYTTYRRHRIYTKMAFNKYFIKELQFAMRFMSSSKKQKKVKSSGASKSKEKLLLMDHQAGIINGTSVNASQCQRLAGKPENSSAFLNRRQIHTNITSPCIGNSEYFGNSQEALGSLSNSKIPWGLEEKC